MCVFLLAWWSHAQQHAEKFGTASTTAKPNIPGKFVDITSASAVRFEHLASHTSKKYLPETMGSGVALFDYDNDGRLDIFLINGAP
ncbi:MAG TPA: VCBS repeat-containing protein, partial [Terriglobales bacterium]|nr:VCBS repeat-containing protein [Terriglobales bacterium]